MTTITDTSTYPTTTVTETTTTETTMLTTTETTTTDTTTTTAVTLFTPGSAGQLPSFDFMEPLPGFIGCLYISKIGMEPVLHGETWESELVTQLDFTIPPFTGVTAIVLQYYDTEGSDWTTYVDPIKGYTYTATDSAGWVIYTDQVITLRLAFTGGELDGYVSNTVTTDPTTIETRFTGDDIDAHSASDSLLLHTVGTTITAWFTVTDTNTGTVIPDGYAFQWYRINPYTFEHYPIGGATQLSYTTTLEDVGYLIGIIATGNETTVGGKREIITYHPVVYPVWADADNATEWGFDLYFDHLVDTPEPSRFYITDSSGYRLNVMAVAQGDDTASYHVYLSEASSSPYYLIGYRSPTWGLTASGPDATEKVARIQIDTAPSEPPFVPGELGYLPSGPVDDQEPGTFAGLYVASVDRHEDFLGYMKSEVELRFPVPAQLAGDTFTLQYYDSVEGIWKDYGEEYITDYNNFVVYIYQNESFRLRATGGIIDGYVSNVVSVSPPVVDTEFTNWSLDESMYLSGIMYPYVGRGLQASFTVVDSDTGELIEGALDYQWYRVDPYTFEHFLISGATDLTYVTTLADLGYFIAIVASGDGVNAGGSMEVISDGTVVTLPVSVFVTDASIGGFTLNFEYLISGGLNPFDLVVYDNDNEAALIDSIVQGSSEAVYVVTVTPKTGNTSFAISYAGTYWQLVCEIGGGFMLMPWIDVIIS